MILNFKGLDYETHWVDYPDIKPLLQSLYTVTISDVGRRVLRIAVILNREPREGQNIRCRQ